MKTNLINARIHIEVRPGMDMEKERVSLEVFLKEVVNFNPNLKALSVHCEVVEIADEEDSSRR